jgi:hypothetical protein
MRYAKRIDVHMKESSVTNLFSTPNPLPGNVPEYKEAADLAAALDRNPLLGSNLNTSQVEG